MLETSHEIDDKMLSYQPLLCHESIQGWYYVEALSAGVNRSLWHFKQVLVESQNVTLAFRCTVSIVL